MSRYAEIFRGMSPARVLDVATGGGAFLQLLQSELGHFDEMIGVDTNERGAASFARAFEGQANIRFLSMDAHCLDFPDGHFDMVCISNSLHHFDNPQVILTEMLRVLHPGGVLVAAEMVRDDQTPTQQTHVLLHHWWAAVDRASGMVHHETYSRDELTALFQTLALKNMQTHEVCELKDDPLDAGLLADMDRAIDRYMERAGEDAELRQRGAALRERLHTVGAHGATTCILIGTK